MMSQQATTQQKYHDHCDHGIGNTTTPLTTTTTPEMMALTMPCSESLQDLTITIRFCIYL